MSAFTAICLAIAFAAGAVTGFYVASIYVRVGSDDEVHHENPRP